VHTVKNVCGKIIHMDETNGTQANHLAGIFPSVRACAEFCGVSERHLRTQINVGACQE